MSASIGPGPTSVSYGITQRGQMMHAEYASVNGLDNGLFPVRRQAIIPIKPQGTHFNGILFENKKFPFSYFDWKMSSAKWRPLCLGLNLLWYIDERVLTH